MHARSLIALALLCGAPAVAGAQPIDCASIAGRPHIVRGRIHQSTLHAGAERFRVYARRDVNGDGADDLLALTLDHGEVECGNYGECVSTAFVACAGGFAQVLTPEYRFGLRFGTSTTRVGGVDWLDLVEEIRVSGGIIDEGERMDAGVDPVQERVHRYDERRGYRGGRPPPHGTNDECARALAEGRLPDARRHCETALRNAVAVRSDPESPPRPTEVRRMRALRGAIHYNLGRLAEAEGDRETARRHYEQSLRERPNDATTQARLEALE